MSRARHSAILAVSLTLAFTLAGCSNPDAPDRSEHAGGPSPENTGEAHAPPPPSPARQAPVNVQASPERALTLFAEEYINWNFQTLTPRQRELAAMSVGSARLTEQQAAASSAKDGTIEQGHIHNSGAIISVAGDLAQHGLWAIITREQTGGEGQYEGLPASYHVTLARVQRVSGGYAVSEWLPQS